MTEKKSLNKRIEIVPASSGDVNALAVLFDGYRQFYGQESDIEKAEQFLCNRLVQKQSVIFWAKDKTGNEGCGFAQLYPSFSSVRMKGLWILNDLFVDEKYRRLGIAEHLIKACQSFVKETGACELMLETANDNLKARQLYIKTGFKQDEEFLTYRFLFS